MSRRGLGYAKTTLAVAVLATLFVVTLGCNEKSESIENAAAEQNSRADHSGYSVLKPELGDCLKVAFKDYCLGGSSNSLPAGGVSRGDGMISFGESAEDAVFVQVNSDTIVAISKPFTPATWLVYQDLLQDIRQIYGPGEEHSYFPGWATTNDEKETAISTRQGRIQHLWRQGDWGVFISWNGRKKITLSYAIPDKMLKNSKGY